jgi:DNA-binding transcriptional MerR regulator
VERGWSLEELVRRATEALAAGDVRAPNARVTPVPDRRLIRWYATIGLVDRPLASQGRTARYGPRHLLQLVAIKRRQAQGYTLAEVQAELTGATDSTLRKIAEVPAELLRDADVPADLLRDAEVAADLLPDVDAREAVPATGAGTRFWTRSTAPPPAVGPPPDGFLHGVRLGEAILLLPVGPDAADLAAIRAAAQPLLDLLVHKGLLPRSEGSTR